MGLEVGSLYWCLRVSIQLCYKSHKNISVYVNFCIVLLL